MYYYNKIDEPLQIIGKNKRYAKLVNLVFMMILPDFLFTLTIFLMKLTTFFFLFFQSITLTAFGQNLVSNPSFEDFEHCLSKKETDEIMLNIPSLKMSKIKDWTCPSLAGTADLFQVCFDSTNGISKHDFGVKASFGAPRNNNGWQKPRTGQAYAGIYAISNLYGDGNYREYLQGKLTKTLEKNKTYTVSFWCSLSDNSTLASQDLAVYFSKKQISYPDTFAKIIPVEPQIRNERGRFLTNKKNWVRVTGSFRAEGNEKYFLIGNFKNYSPQDYLVLFSEKDKFFFIASSYYFIDDVCVSLDPNECFANEKDTIDFDSQVESFLYEPSKMRFKGKISDSKSQKPIEAQIRFFKGSQNYSADSNGNFEIMTDTLNPHFIFFNHENYFPHTERIAQKMLARLDIKLVPLKKGEKVALLNYYASYPKSQMKVVDYSLEDLQNWVTFLEKHPKIKIQIGSHGLPYYDRKLDSSKTVKEANELLKQKSLEKTESLSREIAQKLIELGANPQQISHKGFGDQKYYGSYRNEIEWIEDIENKNLETQTEVWNIQTMEINQKIVLENLLFRPNSAELDSKSVSILEKLGTFLNQNPNVKIAIHGHTDNGFGTTSPSVLQKLSEDRALSVKKYLIAKGISENRLQAKGFGMTEPLASNETDAGKSKNRRTEFMILSK